jgi:hypothetical protein
MSDPDSIEDLQRRMAEAVAGEDYETAARLRDELRVLKGEGSYFQRQTPGKMGLGTDQQVYQPPKDWRRPRKPDPMTTGHKPGGRRRK